LAVYEQPVYFLDRLVANGFLAILSINLTFPTFFP
jgi:hypothetical protein